MTVTRACAGLLLPVCLASAQFGWFNHKRIDKKKPATEPSVVGIVVNAVKGSFILQADDARIITFKTTAFTEYYQGSKFVNPSSVRKGAVVTVTLSADPDGNLTADEVAFQNTLPPLKVPEQTDVLLPGGVQDDPLVQKAREATAGFFRILPNFLCQQSTTRSYAGADQQWKTVDRVTAEVVYVHGHESYRDVRLNGKLTGRGMMDLPGSRSTGEFASTLRALFDVQTEALFKFRCDTVLSGFSTAVYDFAVSGNHSDWRISAGPQTILTPYTGKIWIDGASGNVVRIEMNAVDIPKLFPFQKVDAQVEYGPVDLPSGRYFLPQTAENVSCNDPESCSRNVIEFRNYHKYVGESTISFDAPDKP